MGRRQTFAGSVHVVMNPFHSRDACDLWPDPCKSCPAHFIDRFSRPYQCRRVICRIACRFHVRRVSYKHDKADRSGMKGKYRLAQGSNPGDYRISISTEPLFLQISATCAFTAIIGDHMAKFRIFMICAGISVKCFAICELRQCVSAAGRTLSPHARPSPDHVRSVLPCTVPGRHVRY